MRDLGNEVRPAVDVAKLLREAQQLQIQIVDFDRTIERATKAVEDKRLKLGRVLVEARKAFPRSGPKAAGWGRFLADVGVSQQTAHNYMRLTGYVESFHKHEPDVCENSDAPAPLAPIPPRLTYREAGIDNRPRRDEREIGDPIPEEDLPPPPSDQQRAALRNEIEARRTAERQQAAGGPMEEREERIGDYLIRLATAQRQVMGAITGSFHLRDATTNPGDFEQAKKMWIDIVRAGLDELEEAGVLDGGPTTKRQLILLKGGQPQ